MNSSSALQPKQVIWLPQPQIKLVWFNFRFGLLLQLYIKGDIFHYTAKPRAGRQAVVARSLHRKTSWEHYGIYSICCRSSQADGGIWCHWWACYPQASTDRHTLNIFRLFRQLQAKLWQGAGSSGCTRDHMPLLQWVSHQLPMLTNEMT